MSNACVEELVQLGGEELVREVRILGEHVGGRILNALRAELPLTEAIDRIEVEITKFAPPIGGECDRITVVLQG